MQDELVTFDEMEEILLAAINKAKKFIEKAAADKAATEKAAVEENAADPVEQDMEAVSTEEIEAERG